jgi:streptogramin lyase
MNHPEQNPKKPTATAGFSAMLDGLLHVKGSGAPWLRGLILAPFLTALYLICFAPGTALGKTVHVLSSSFTGSGASALSEPVGVAVNDESEDVYVVDRGHNRVEQFNATGGTVLGEFNGSSAPTGAFSAPEAVAVDNDLLSGSHGDVYVVDSGHGVVDRFSAAGAYEGQLTGTCATAGEVPPACVGSTFVAFKALHGVAVDPEGDVWVYENEAAGEGEVAELSDTGTFLKAFRTERGTKSGIALDASGHVYVVFGSGDVGEYEASSGTEVGKNENENAAGIAIDTGDLFIDTGGRIEEYGLTEPFSSRVESFPGEGLSGSEGIATNATGTVYATEHTADSVEVFDEDPLPAVSTEAVSNRAVHSATLNGTVNPEGVPITSCVFEYGTEAGVYPHKEPCAHTAPLTGAAAVAVTANLTGLSPDVTYHYRLDATNADNLSEVTSDETFTARGPGISEEQVRNVEATAATLQADIDPNESKRLIASNMTRPRTPAAPRMVRACPSRMLRSARARVPCL